MDAFTTDEGGDNSTIAPLSPPMDYQEQLRRQTIINSIENKDYLLVIASQQNKSVQQVIYELKLKLVTQGC
ncbi:uncharacterized protein J8A68_002840 [[Candida] subhashii]|uniref:Uncharacterized protein n=1 Tax=[Candida] subhashii TaxID=561895 RepID=A0A8J5QFM6_9ASCO|nr:uncharacterized protein J8A68_002840 [[Candida] subhashii]KAG7663591.1 hypothetical protein J8A68_002840 [[Candida] subhashii]